ncbi:hypothetical protein [Sphingomonas colocasiae]|uniref:Cytosine permease n=1 Tax=Sphingomonas colocasiae TaxID=1848973 RepID=A0ABS7PKM4_9SPHN|nr:hypothetical protein [Sphingomonas colocasiae]MBY8821778.1 hypothetical protein [Sphingomonas colocasiae]
MTGDFPRQPVPEDRATRPAATVALIVANAVIGVPIIFLGGSIDRDHGMARGALIIVIGCALTAALAMLTAWAGVRSRCSTALLAERSFGRQGALVLNVALGAALLGWFAVEMGFIGQLLASAMRLTLGIGISPAPGIVVASLVIGVVAMFGIAVIARAPLLFAPLLVLLVGFVGFAAIPRLSEAPVSIGGTSIGTGISAIVGAYVVGCLIMPDYSRFVGKARNAAIAAGVALGPVWAVVLGCYAAAGAVTRSDEPITILLALGMPAMLTLLLPLGLMQNGIMCLYSSALATSTWLRGLRFPAIVLATMVLGMALALAGVQAGFVGFLVLLAFVFPPAAAILAVEALFAPHDGSEARAGFRFVNLAIWALGSLAAALSEYHGMGLSGISALDGFMIAFAASFMSLRIRKPDAAHASS